MLGVGVGRSQVNSAKASQIGPQDGIDATDMIGRWNWDIPNDRAFADPTVALLFGVDPALAEVGTPLARFMSGMHFEDREPTQSLIERCARAGRSYLAEYRVCSADGHLRWVLARGRFTLSPTGFPLRGSGILIDITQKWFDEADCSSATVLHSDHPLERAAEHCLAAHKAINELPRSALHSMSEALLLEVGRQLAKLEINKRHASMN